MICRAAWGPPPEAADNLPGQSSLLRLTENVRRSSALRACCGAGVVAALVATLLTAQARADNADPLSDLVDAATQRLQIAEQVAAFKWNTHGAIASASAEALVAVLAARRSAGSRMAAVSDGLCDKLTEAAKRYEQSDDSMSAILRSQTQIGQI